MKTASWQASDTILSVSVTRSLDSVGLATLERLRLLDCEASGQFSKLGMVFLQG
jgi:hypothetical protein